MFYILRKTDAFILHAVLWVSNSVLTRTGEKVEDIRE
jgi:hypothetical protein